MPDNTNANDSNGFSSSDFESESNQNGQFYRNISSIQRDTTEHKKSVNSSQNFTEGEATTNSQPDNLNGIVAGSSAESQSEYGVKYTIALVQKLPNWWSYVPVGRNKVPIGFEWQHNTKSKEEILGMLAAGECSAVGVLLGEASGGLLDVDIDGEWGEKKVESLSMLPLEEALPHTFKITSGLLHRSRNLYYVPDRYWNLIKYKDWADAATGEGVEFRWSKQGGSHQSIVAGFHPKTGSYHFLTEPEDISEAPAWVLDLMLVTTDAYKEARSCYGKNDVAFARILLASLKPERADAYQSWISVGMALKSVADELLEDWIEWSRQSSNFDGEEVCEKHWHSFNGEGRTLGTLYFYATEDGWVPDENFKKRQELGLDPDDDAGENTFDKHVYIKLFQEGVEDWVTINQAFFQNTGKGYWKHISDEAVYRWLTEASMRTYKIKTKGEEAFPTYPFAKNQAVESAYKFNIKALAVKEQPSNTHLRCFKNCTVDMRTGAVLPHSRDHFLTTAIPVDYKPNLSCPKAFRDFILDSYGEEFLELIQALTAWLLDPTAPYGYFVHLIGQSGTGKGTLLRFWAELFGEHSHTGNFSNLTTPEYRHQHLTGAAVFSIPDVGGFLKSVTDFYELVDNGQMSGRPLFTSTAYTKLWNVRFLVASVNHLRIENAGEGWERRCIPIPTKRRSSIDPDHTLRTRLAEVKAEVISWALSMPREKRDDLIRYATRNNETIASLQLEAKIQSDSVAGFADACLVPAENKNFLDNSTLFASYKAYCQAHGLLPKNFNMFISQLKSTLPEIYRVKTHWGRDSKGERVKIGAHWQFMDIVPGAFNITPQMDLDTHELTCYQSACKQGQLSLLTESTLVNRLYRTCTGPVQDFVVPEPLSSGGVQGVQGVQGGRAHVEKFSSEFSNGDDGQARKKRRRF